MVGGGAVGMANRAGSGPSSPELDVRLEDQVGDFQLAVAFRVAPVVRFDEDPPSSREGATISVEGSTMSTDGPSVPAEDSPSSNAGITALFGPSGAGKTLTLRHLAGLARARSGRIRLGERVLFDSATGIHLPPRARRIGLVFQEAALFPHLSVAGNVGYGMSGLRRDVRTDRVDELLDLVRLPGYGERRPRSLSGGEAQRVALARALAPGPSLLLLDEPFAALDFRVRRELRSELLRLGRLTGIPMILVTHSLADVKALSRTLILLDRGRVVASGPTDRLLADPGTPEAAALLDAEEL
jgi:ABC-type sulfate/molybdate transport systems ATPase subunit